MSYSLEALRAHKWVPAAPVTPLQPLHQACLWGAPQPCIPTHVQPHLLLLLTGVLGQILPDHLTLGLLMEPAGSSHPAQMPWDGL